MKKLILLLILPLTTLIAIEFTMTKEGLFANTTTKPTVAPVTLIVPNNTTNLYIKTINIPTYNPKNSEHFLISSIEDWSHINDPDKINFYVKPGDYTRLRIISGGQMLPGIILTRSGTADRKRTLSLYNGNDTHPGKLNLNQLANYTLDIQGASYWTIDRAASFNVNFSHSFILNRNATHNIFNRMFTQNLFHTMWLRNHADNNTIQNSRFDGITKKGAEADLATLNLLHHGESVEILGTKVVNNEFVNVKAMRLARAPLNNPYDPHAIRQAANFAGTIFDNNTVEFNNKIRTDCKGNYTPDGKCMGMEAMALGTKAGSNDPEKPYIVSNNKIWGGLPSDPTLKTLSSRGGFINIYMGAKNIHVLNNIIFNTTRALYTSDRHDKPRGSYNIIIENNIVVNSGNRYRSKDSTSLGIHSAEGITVKNNLIKDPIGKWSKVSGNFYNNYFGNNDVINFDTPMEYQNNAEPVEGVKPIDTNNYYATPEASGYTKDYNFTTDKFTDNPRTITLKNVLKSK